MTLTANLRHYKCDGTQTKILAWNGVQFAIPADWEIGRMGLRYLHLEDDRGPVFEVKWQPIKGRFVHKTHLKRLTGMRSRRAGLALQLCKTPGQWQAALAGFAVEAFEWQGGALAGKGAVLYCPHCRTAHLLQFLRRDIVRNKRLCRDILASFEDHRDDKAQAWAVYDIRALTPDRLRLKQYRFDAGAFELAFDGPEGLALHLHRWGPAALMLKAKNLRQFCNGMWPWLQSAGPQEGAQNDRLLKVVNAPLAGNRLDGLMRRLCRKPLYGWLAARHATAQNRIMAVSALGRRPLPGALLEKVYDHYEIV